MIELFGKEEPQRKRPIEKLTSSLTRRVADGTLRQVAELSGEFFVELKIYNTADICDVDPRQRWEKAVATLRMQLTPDSPEWDITKKLFAKGKNKFEEEATFYADKNK